jgi:hypothetical protein
VNARDGDLAAGAGVAIGHRYRTALVAGGVEIHTRRVQGVEDCEVAAAGQTETDLDSALGQSSPDRFGDSHLGDLHRSPLLTPLETPPVEYASVLAASLRAGGAKIPLLLPFGLISGRVGSNLRVIRRVAQRIPPVEVVGGFSVHKHCARLTLM